MWDGLWFHLRALFRRKSVEQELDEEIEYHLERQAAAYRARGVAPGEALRQARLAFGGLDAAKDDCRQARASSLLEAAAKDLRFACRLIRKSPGFALTAVTVLAVAIAANTAVFSFVRAIVIERLPVAGADRLVRVGHKSGLFHDDGSSSAFRYSFFQRLRERDADFEDLLAVGRSEEVYSVGEQTGRLKVEIVSGNYFAMLGVRAALGRVLGPRDDSTEGAGAVCVISDGFWREHFAGSRDAIGRRITIGGTPFEIVGVSQPGFDGAALHDPYDVQVPSSMLHVFFGQGRDTMGWARIVGRLKPGVGWQRAAARLAATAVAIESQAGHELDKGESFLMLEGSQGIGIKKDRLGKPAVLLLLLVGVVLLIACANLAAMLLARSVERTREAGVRLALGASRAALMRQFLCEGVLLAIGGGAAGWLLAQVLVGALLRLLGAEGEGIGPHIRPDLAVFGFCGAISLAAAALVSILPAWRAAHAEPLNAIRGVAAGGFRQPVASRLLVVLQVALSLVLLVGAGLFVRTLHNLRSVDLGVLPENLVLMEVDLEGTRQVRTPEPFFTELLRAARRMPGARDASLTQINAFAGSEAIVVRVPGYRPREGTLAATSFNVTSAGYFRTLGIPLLAGRDFADGDRGSGEGAVIVNERFVNEFFGGGALDHMLGKVFSYAAARKVHVVGVAGNARLHGLREDIEPMMYLPVTQWHFPSDLYLQVRTSSDAAHTIARLRAMLRTMEPRLMLGQAATMEMQIDRALARERLLAFLSTVLGGVAVTLVAIGLYGVVSFSVARRVREIGIRMAVGAGGGRILRLFVKEGVVTVTAGTALGLPLALGASRLAASLLFGLKAGDPLTLAGAAAMLGAVALGAALIPAWRATRLDAMAALREE